MSSRAPNSGVGGPGDNGGRANGGGAVARERQERVVERLGALERDGACRVETETWPQATRLDGRGAPGDPDGSDAAALAAYREYDAWTTGRGASLDPAFERRTLHCAFTGRHRHEVVLPVVSLAVYEDGRLDAVFPHRRGNRVFTVEDGLVALSRATAPREPPEGPRDPPGEPAVREV